MNTQLQPTTDQSRPTSAPAPTPVAPPQQAATQSGADQPGRGRPFALDPAKRDIVGALVAQGYSLTKAAQFVGCTVKTIRNDAQRNPEFAEQLRYSYLNSRLQPLQNVRAAGGDDWRAAAWMLERTEPECFARGNSATFDTKQLRQLLHEVLQIIDNEAVDPTQHERITNGVRACFEYRARVAGDRRRTKRGLRQAIELFEQKEALSRPAAHATRPAPKEIANRQIVADQPPTGRLLSVAEMTK
jgi:hypothetical protein